MYGKLQLRFPTMQPSNLFNRLITFLQQLTKLDFKNQSKKLVATVLRASRPYELIKNKHIYFHYLNNGTNEVNIKIT